VDSSPGLWEKRKVKSEQKYRVYLFYTRIFFNTGEIIKHCSGALFLVAAFIAFTPAAKAPQKCNCSSKG
jgi:hypothetical protein